MNRDRSTVDALTADIKSLAGASTADLVGIAAGGAFTAQELGDLGARFGPVQSVIVLAQRIVDPIQTVRFRSGAGYDDSRVAASFADAMLRDACWRAVEILRDAGCRAAIARNLRYGADDPRHHLSYKKAGVLAGLGAFGRSQLLIHPAWGPWLRLRVVVTDAALPPDAPIDLSPCYGCRLCVEACPSGALAEEGFDRAACENFYGEPASHTVAQLSPNGYINCEECMRACPVGAAPPRFAAGVGKP